MIVVRFLFVLLLGFILGVGATLYLIHSGAGDLVIRRTEAVQDLERRLRDVEQQRDSLSRQLDDVIARATMPDPDDRYPSVTLLADALARRDGPVPARTTASRKARCVLCQTPEPFGIGVCPRCARRASGGEDVVVFLGPVVGAGIGGGTDLALWAGASMTYVPLGIHTEYSLLHGMCRVDALVERARALQLSAVGMADLHSAYGFVHFDRAAASRTFCTAGRSRPIRMAMMAMTTSNSISVNAPPRREGERTG